MINKKNLGCLDFEGFVSRKEVDLSKVRMAFVGAGQAGGKIVTEFIRLGYYGCLYNTCNEDLQDIKNKLAKMQNIKYKTIKLEGYDGTSKDRNLGLKAIKDNKELLEKELLADDELIKADFVWIVVGLGGGTGNGSLNIVSKILSGVMRKDKRYKIIKNGERIKSIGKPTVGIICAIPEEFSKHKIKLNAALALKEIRELQRLNLIGSVLLVDNQKMIDDYLENSKTNNSKDWTTNGNTTIARLLVELCAMTCLPGRETLDKSELLDIFSTPGFLSIGKKKIKSNYLNNGKVSISNLVESSFIESSVFTTGYDFKQSLHGGMGIITPLNENVLTIKETILLKQALNSFLDSPEVEVTHFGIFNNNVFGTYKSPNINNDEALIYTLAVTKELPNRILKMTKTALEIEKQKREKSLEDHNELDILLQQEQNSDRMDLISFDFEDLFIDDGNETDSTNKTSNPLDDIF